MVIILGGGISGLAAGYYFRRYFPLPLTIYESSMRLGGWIRTERHESKGFIFEIGPRTIRPKGLAGANTLEMIEELQLPVETINSQHPAALNRMIYAKNKLCLLPNSLFGLFRKLEPFSKPLVSALFKDWRTQGKTIDAGDESIYDFVERRFGTEIATYAISPMICGICAGDAKEISVHFLMKELFELEQTHGSITRGIFREKFMKPKQAKPASGLFAEPESKLFERAKNEKWSMYRTQNGLDVLPRKLGEYLTANDVTVRTGASCTNILFMNDQAYAEINNQEVVTDHVISALPAHVLANCIESQHIALATQLRSIPYVDVAVVNLQYKRKDLLKMRAFGHLVPPVEGLPVLGVIFDSCCFDMADNTVLTVMLGGRWSEQYFGEQAMQKDVLKAALQHVEQALGIRHEPTLQRVNILQKCIPQQTVGHRQRVQQIRQYIDKYDLPLTLCGAAYDGVGINDVILSARRQVESLIQT